MYKKKIENAAKTNGAAQSLTAEVRLEQRPKKDCLKKPAGKKGQEIWVGTMVHTPTFVSPSFQRL